MKVEIIEKTENPLLKRTDVKFKVDHSGGPTPRRLDVRVQLAAQLGVSEELVVIGKLASTRGRQVASGIARTYNSREQLESIEPKYLLKRGVPKEAKAEAKPEEKPKIEKLPEKKVEKLKEAGAPEKPEEKAEKPPEGAKPAGKAKEVKEKPKESGEDVKES
jgi:small subunit ribosomal protein S24e